LFAWGEQLALQRSFILIKLIKKKESNMKVKLIQNYQNFSILLTYLKVITRAKFNEELML